MRSRGKNAYVTPSNKLDEGECTYCRRWAPLTYDHALPRSTFPEYRNDHRFLVPACWTCQNAREATTWKPRWSRLPKTMRELMLASVAVGRLQRLFEGVPDAPTGEALQRA